MIINWLVIPTLGIALLLFMVGQQTVGRCRTFRGRLALSGLWLLLGIPGFLFPLYYLHLFDDAKWFYAFRSLPFSELTAAGAGLFAGALAALTKQRKFVSRPFLIILLVVGIIAPHLKPVFAPLPAHRFSERWEDGVCMQSTQASCGPACAATIFRKFGVSLSEEEIARECFTSLTGTENWYLARAFRRRGCIVNYRIEKGLPEDLRTPAIAGIRMEEFGHFIAIIDKTDSKYVTADPLVGKKVIPANEMAGKFDFTGFFMEIQKEN